MHDIVCITCTVTKRIERAVVVTSDGSVELLRRREVPQRVTHLELFLDLVYVLALTRVSQRLIEDYTADRRTLLPELLQTALMLAALWFVWTCAAWVTSKYDPRQPRTQLALVWVMFGSMILAVALPSAFTTRGLVFAVTYVAIQLGRPLLLLPALRGPARQVPLQIATWAATSAVPWIAGAALFPHNPGRGVLWTIGLVIDYLGFILGWPVPGLGRTNVADWAITGEHLAERYQQFVIIALGESILVTGLTFAREFTLGKVAPIVVAFVSTVLMWRIYFHSAGLVLPAAIETAARPARLGHSSVYIHLVLVAGIVATGVGNELVIDHPLKHLDPMWLGLIFGGPAMFLAARGRLEYDIYEQVSRSWPTGLVALAALTPVVLHLPPLAATSTAAVVLAGVALWDTKRARKRRT
jgi:low temperature requirement protein LtrA